MSDLPPTPARRITVRALLLGDRIETAGLERKDVLSTVPLAFRAGENGVVALFRYGVAVLVGMSPLEEEEVIERLDGRIVAPIAIREEESVQIEVAPDKDDQITPPGIIVVKALTTEHTLLIADALATSVILAHDEKNVTAVFDVIQPIARELAERGRTPGGRRAILKHIAAGGAAATAPAVPRTGPSAGRGSAAAAGGAGGKLTVCGAASDGAGQCASTFSSAARTWASTDSASCGLPSGASVPAVIGLISAVPAVVGLWEGAAWVAFTVVRAGRLAAGPASGAAAGRGSSASAEAGGTGWGGWARGVLDITPLALGTAWMAAGVGAGSRADQGK